LSLGKRQKAKGKGKNCEIDLKLIDNYADRKLQRWQIKQVEQKDSLIKLNI
jgi:hypothetical protein